jgi:sigma54-dependent transcription regulator
MNIRTSFRFTLPKGTGIKVEPGRKASGTMRLAQVKDLVLIERDGLVQRGTGAFYVVLLSKTITSLGTETMITRKTIEQLNPVDFAFLVDFLHEINHQVIKKTPMHCAACGRAYLGEFNKLGEA